MSRLGYERHTSDPHYLEEISIYFRKDGSLPQIIGFVNWGNLQVMYVYGRELLDGRFSMQDFNYVSRRKFNDEGFMEDLYAFAAKVEKGLIPDKGDF